MTRSWDTHWKALKFSLQALAQSAAYQHRLLSVWSENVEELPERFSHAERRLRLGVKSEFTADQQKALAAMRACFESFCGPQNSEHWQEASLDSSPHWESVRHLAVQCLIAFEWPMIPPPLELAAYGEDYSEDVK